MVAARAGNLLRLAARRVNAPALRSKAPVRGSQDGPDPNAVGRLPSPSGACIPSLPDHSPPPPASLAAGGTATAETLPDCCLLRSPPCVRTLPAFERQPKWEQAVRSVLRKDEHVVFGVIGMWVRAGVSRLREEVFRCSVSSATQEEGRTQ